MTSHEFARKLLELEDRPIVITVYGGWAGDCYYDIGEPKESIMRYDPIGCEYYVAKSGGTKIWLVE